MGVAVDEAGEHRPAAQVDAVIGVRRVRRGPHPGDGPALDHEGGAGHDAQGTVAERRVIGDELADTRDQGAHRPSHSGAIAVVRSRPTSPSTCCPSETTTLPSTTTVCTSAAPAARTSWSGAQPA